LVHKINDEKSMPEARAERLKRVRNLANLSRIEMCVGTNLNVNTLKGWEISRFGGLSKNGAEKIVARLASVGVICSVDWLMYEIGDAPQVNLSFTTEIPIEIMEPNLTEEKEKKLMTEELLLFRSHTSKSLDYIITDDSMSPMFEKGDMVAGVKVKNPQETVGKPAIVTLQDGRKLLRKIYKGTAPQSFTLIAIALESNAKDLILLDTPVKLIAPVIWHRKRSPGRI
jgi:transcriptional regulator with XRE-family HTH domain